MNIYKKQYVYLILIILLLILVLTLVSLFSGKTQQETPPTKTPTARVSSPPANNLPLKIDPILTEEVPSKPAGEGGGVDLNSSVVQQSQTEIAKILPSLPYQTQIQSSTGSTISILIPGAQFQTTPWILDVQVSDIDYQVNEGDADYNIQRDLFKSGAASVFAWLKSVGTDPEKIIIDWGDKLYIREHAEKWLTE